MNYKIIAIFTSLILVLGTLAVIPFGIWLERNELISTSPMFHLFYLGMYMTGLVVEFIVFYFLYMQKINKPTQHAFIIGILCLIISNSLLYILVGIQPPPLLVVIDTVITVIAIYLALYIAKIRGKLSISA